MNTRADRNQDHKSQQAAANRLHRKQPEKTSMLEMADERPEAIQMQQLQEMAANSSRVKQLTAIAEMASSNPGIMQLKALQQIMYSSPRTKQLMAIRNLAGTGPRAQQSLQLQTKMQAHTLQKYAQLGKGEEEALLQGQFETVQQATSAQRTGSPKPNDGKDKSGHVPPAAHLPNAKSETAP